MASVMGLICVLVSLVFSCITVSEAGHTHQGYFQYLNVPAPGQYEFGFNRGNAKHYISRYEQAKDWKFRTKVRWGDEKGGYGEHYFDYNHVDKQKHGDGGGGGDDGAGHGWTGQQQAQHSPHQYHHESSSPGVTHHGWHGGYSEPQPAIVPAAAAIANMNNRNTNVNTDSGESQPKGLQIVYVPPTPSSSLSQNKRSSNQVIPENRRRFILPQEWQEPLPQPQTLPLPLPQHQHQHLQQQRPQQRMRMTHRAPQQAPPPPPTQSRSRPHRLYRGFRHY